jgi:hypothetical protein
MNLLYHSMYREPPPFSRSSFLREPFFVKTARPHRNLLILNDFFIIIYKKRYSSISKISKFSRSLIRVIIRAFIQPIQMMGHRGQRTKMIVLFLNEPSTIYKCVIKKQNYIDQINIHVLFKYARLSSP